jgi:hypothetical protein
MVILILRGHIRDSFEDDDLYNFVKNIASITPLEIYISTWSVYANNLSWRQVKEDNRQVTRDNIYAYFRDVRNNIRHITIEHDEQSVLVGRSYGYLGGGKMPILGWKYMWYGNYNIIEHINKSQSPEEIVINTRLDILKNSNASIYTPERLYGFINYCVDFFCNKKNVVNKNVFMFGHEWAGIDNIFIGNVRTMHKLISHFHFNLDVIEKEHEDGKFMCPHELLVFRENEKLFG